MSEFNLIPEEFFVRDQKRGALWWAAIALGVVTVLSVVSYAGVEFTLASHEKELTQLREQKALSMQQRDKLTSLQKRKEQLAIDMLLLSSLRSGATMPELVQQIETALPGNEVRFESLHFRRAGIRTEDEEEARPPSYFIIARSPDQFPKQWESMTHMTIHGEAKDHAALSRFVQRLFEQSNVDDVKIQRSSQSASGVSFHVAVVVKSSESHS